MKRYTIRIRGENYQVVLEGRTKRVGFYTIRFVNAENPSSAEALALKAVRKDAAERMDPGASGPAGLLFVEAVEEGTSPDLDHEVTPGFVYFEE